MHHEVTNDRLIALQIQQHHDGFVKRWRLLAHFLGFILRHQLVSLSGVPSLALLARGVVGQALLIA